MGILERTDKIVSEKATQVFETLGRVKFLLVTVPILCVLVGLAMQQLIPERNVATTSATREAIATSRPLCTRRAPGQQARRSPKISTSTPGE